MKNQRIHNLSDDELLIGYQSTNDDRFFEGIYKRHSKKVYHTCLGIVKDKDVAHDLVQDVMIKVLENLPGFQNGKFLGFWIYRIARNHSFDYLRDNKKRRSVSVCNYCDLAYEISDLEALETIEKRLESIENALLELSEGDRILLKLKYFENYSVENLQNTFTLSKSAVKMRLARARRRMMEACQRKQLAVACA